MIVNKYNIDMICKYNNMRINRRMRMRRYVINNNKLFFIRLLSKLKYSLINIFKSVVFPEHSFPNINNLQLLVFIKNLINFLFYPLYLFLYLINFI